MSLLNRMEETKKVWTLLMPWCEQPVDSTFARWLMKFTDEEMETTFYQTSAHWHDKAPIRADIVHRFVTATLHHRRDKLRKAKLEEYRRQSAEGGAVESHR